MRMSFSDNIGPHGGRRVKGKVAPVLN